MPDRNETGHSTASINRERNETAWRGILPALRSGGTLKRERTGYYYAGGNGGLTAAFVAARERDGTLRRIGADTYALAEIADV